MSPPLKLADQCPLGIFLSDIAAVHSDVRTLGFRLCRDRLSTTNALSIIGCERTVDVLVASTDSSQLLKRWLPLICLNSLPPEDYRIRKKTWRSYVSRGLIPRNMKSIQTSQAETLLQLIQGKGIPIEEESFSPIPPHSGFYTCSNILSFDPGPGCLRIVANDAQSSASRSIPIAAVVEVRAGKLSAILDEVRDAYIMTIIAADQIVCLPLPTIALRNQLIQYFQVSIAYDCCRRERITRLSSLLRHSWRYMATPIPCR
jgi:hypothetical protein